MARHESEREDLLREATALVLRVELKLPHEPEPVVIGFRRNGCASFFFGGEPVVQFNTAGELRRLYFEGEMLKAEDRRLVALRRERTAAETTLVRTLLSDERQEEIVTSVQNRITALQRTLAQDKFELIGQVPADGSVLAAVRDWLATHSAPWLVAAAPNAV